MDKINFFLDGFIQAGTKSLDDESYQRRRCSLLNASSEKQADDGFYCPICGNNSARYRLEGLEIFGSPCQCIQARAARLSFEKSGLSRKSLDNFETTQPFQSQLISVSRRYLETGIKAGAWLFLAGQTGCGKTHCASAVLGELILQHGKAGKLITWRDFAQGAKSRMNSGGYEEYINEAANIDVLYIDDLLKTPRGQDPTTGDLNLLFEVIDRRYRENRPTIISSEFDIKSLAGFDEAIAGRIAEKSKDYYIAVGKDIRKNYRLR